MPDTITASLALAGVSPPAVHAGANVLRGTYVLPTGFSLSTANAMLLMAKIPVNAKDVQITAYTAQAGTAPTANISFGIRVGHTGSNSTSITASALGVTAQLGSTYIGPPYTPNWDDDESEQYKYVTATLAAGTASASITVNYAITYSF